MAEKSFMSEIFEYEKIILGEIEQRFLHLICLKGKVSAYGILLILRNEQRPMNYRNVHTRVKRLKELGLIEPEDHKFKRNAIRYNVTSRGIFQLMLMDYFIPSTMNQYKDDIIMRTIIYEYFEPRTIEKFVTLLRVRAIHEYLRECCEAILKKLEEVREPNLLIYQIKSKLSVSEITDQSLVLIKEHLMPEFKDLITFHVRKFLFQIISVSKIKHPLVDNDPYSPKLQKYRIDSDPSENDDGENYVTLFPIPVLRHDKKFMKLLKEVKKDFDNGCKNFL